MFQALDKRRFPLIGSLKTYRTPRALCLDRTASRKRFEDTDLNGSVFGKITLAILARTTQRLGNVSRRLVLALLIPGMLWAGAGRRI